MNARSKKLICYCLLGFWIALHFAGLYFASVGQKWQVPYVELILTVPFLLILSTPLYVWFVHRLDERWELGGVGSYLQQQRNNQSNADRSGPAHQRSSLAKETVTITTGFAAILFFSAVRFQMEDLRSQQAMNGEAHTTLATVAVLFSFVCVLNLIQLLVLRLLDYQGLKELNRQLHRKLRLLNINSWHSLVTAFVLLLLLQSSWSALFVNALYSCCVFCYYFTIVPEGVAEVLSGNG